MDANKASASLSKIEKLKKTLPSQVTNILYIDVGNHYEMYGGF